MSLSLEPCSCRLSAEFLCCELRGVIRGRVEKMASVAGGTVQALRGVSTAFYRLPSSTVLRALATKPSISGSFGASRRWRKVENVNWGCYGARCVASAASTAASNVVVSEKDVAGSSPTTSGNCHISCQFDILALNANYRATLSV